MDSTLECITDWMTRQRWYASKGRVPELRRIGEWTLPTPEPGVRVHTLLLMDDASRPATLYQVPVTRRETLLAGAGHRLIGRVASGGYLYDGAHDPAYAPALLEMILDGTESIDGDAIGTESIGGESIDGESTGGGSTADTASATASRSSRAGDRSARGARARVLEGEQSNTSIIYEATDGGAPIIVKVFRQLHHGDNPDVTLQTALAEAASTHVPPSVGAVVGEWADVGRTGGRARGHLAFAQEFLPGVEDAWRVALRSAADGTSFDEEARAIGGATAEVHQALADLFETNPATPGDIAGVVFGWHERLAAAASEIPALREHRPAIEAAYDRAQAMEWPPLQRVHGDLHLGQVLSAPGRDWMLIDFEGEPLRPMADRVRPDVVLRDVAGMLRSFDYVAGSVGMERPSRGATEIAAWATDSRQAFLRGYADAARIDLGDHGTVRDAFELDKAVYEALYEQRNRQDWLPIPLLGIVRILGRSAVAGSVGTQADAILAQSDAARRS